MSQGVVLDRAETLIDAVEQLAGETPGHEALTFLDRGGESPMALGPLWRRAREVQATLQARGLSPGDTMIIALPTGSELLAAYLGAMAAGAIPALAPTPFNRVADPAIYMRMLGNVVRNAGARLVYCGEDVAGIFAAGAPSDLERVELVGPEQAGPVREPPTTVAAAPDDIATIQYSSGTTGAQKGVQLTNRAMLSYTRVLRDGLGLEPGEVHVNWAPLYHDMGLFGAFLLPLLSGGRSVLIPTADFLREPAMWLRAIDRHSGAVSWAPNFAYALCAKRVRDEDIEGLDLSSWRVALNASEPLLPTTIEAFAERFVPYGFRREAMSGAWGLAEVVMVGTLDPLDRAPRIDRIDRERLASEGRAVPVESGGVRFVATGQCLPGFEMEIRDAGLRALGDRQVGDVWLRSATLFAGYRGNAELTREIVIDGWINSGDRGYTVEGDLFYVSRSKDLIILGGENYAPHDVEDAVNRVLGVREGCVVAFGVTNEASGTEELAVVAETREEGEAERHALLRAIRAEVMGEMGLGIRHLHLVPPGGVEKTTSGKLARGATRARHAEVFDAGH